MLTVRHLKLPTVPRTGHDTVRQRAFRQRTPLMRTNTVDRVKLTIDVEQRDDPPRDDEFFRTSWLHIRH